jgi:holo-ACP synthase CitX
MSNIFDGAQVSLMEMLDARENRVYKQRNLLTKFPKHVLVSMTMNIPGEVKNSESISRVFEQTLEQVKGLLETDLIDVNDSNVKTGREAFLLTSSMSAEEVKHALVKFEEENERNRLFDLDVIYQDGDDIKQLSRTDLNLPKRLCLICDQEAKSCSRSRKHSVKELQEKIERLITNE